jgi:hypothetical protein
MTRTAILAWIYPHEQEAMLKLTQLARALASTLDGREAATMRVWAQMVEDVIERIESKETVQ